jgi:hypothetical protein
MTSFWIIPGICTMRPGGVLLPGMESQSHCGVTVWLTSGEEPV